MLSINVGQVCYLVRSCVKVGVLEGQYVSLFVEKCEEVFTAGAAILVTGDTMLLYCISNLNTYAQSLLLTLQ